MIAVVLVGMTIVVVGRSLDWPILNAIRKSHCYKEYVFINADIVCGEPDSIRKTSYLTLQETINTYIEQRVAEGSLTEAAVYFRDLKHGPTFGVNELADFAPASLLKLPLAFVFFRSAEVQPELLSKPLQYEGSADVFLQRVKPKQSAVPNTQYPIEQLLALMLTYSDNAAYEMLESFLAETEHRTNLRLGTFQEIGLINPTDRVEETVSVRGYAALFRLLYNASYLSPEYSEKILDMLVQSDYDAGIRAPIPASIKVAHKFGERDFADSDSKQLHDCGVIYYPKNPYLLCVMSIGTDWSELEETISEISKMVYDEVDSRKI